MITSNCQQESGGWTLVARVQGMSGDFSPTSPLWANEDVVSPWDAADLTQTTSMKNPGWFSVPNQVVRVCYSGPRSHCATFSHNRGLTLTQLFGTQFAVEVQEEYTFESLMKKLGKHLDLGHLKTASFYISPLLISCKCFGFIFPSFIVILDTIGVSFLCWWRAKDIVYTRLSLCIVPGFLRI